MTLESPLMKRAKGRDGGHHGRRAEKNTARRLGGSLQPGSGALEGAKGDIKKDSTKMNFLMENKATSGQSLSMKKDWLLKINQEALDTNRVPALAFQFTTEDGRSEPRERWVAVPEHIFRELTED